MKYLVMAGSRSFTVEARSGTDALIDVKGMIQSSSDNATIGESLRKSLADGNLNFLVIRLTERGEREALVCGELKGETQTPVSDALVEAFNARIPNCFFAPDGTILSERNVPDACPYFAFINSLAL
ncbi:MAG TPA: hypothetical protein V6D17_17980 [Candidatus Obscuribacterales bacterium]